MRPYPLLALLLSGCTLLTGAFREKCGDGFRQDPEECDDANDIDDDDTCKNDCTLSCGDGEPDPGEECDDGNEFNTDACTNVCELAACGDGFVQSPENCEDGNDIDEDECTNACTLRKCNDGVLGIGEFCFGDVVAISVGDGPSAIVAGDFDGSGFADLAVTNKVSSDVSVLLADGAGLFDPPLTPFALGLQPVALAVGALDGDNLDLVTANATDNTARVARGNGNGTFTALINDAFPVGVDPSGVALGDVNNDTILDIVTSNRGSNNVAVLLGDGVTFGVAQFTSVGPAPSALALGELVGDDSLDLVVVNEGDDTVSVLKGDATGLFLEELVIGVGSKPVFVAVDDLDADKDLDIVVVNAASATVSVLLQTGKNEFTREDFTVDNNQQNANPLAVAIADMNNDGNLDLVVANHDDGNIAILEGVGDGGFLAPRVFCISTGPAAVIAVTVNGDPLLDLALVSDVDNTVGVCLSNP